MNWARSLFFKRNRPVASLMTFILFNLTFFFLPTNNNNNRELLEKDPAYFKHQKTPKILRRFSVCFFSPDYQMDLYSLEFLISVTTAVPPCTPTIYLLKPFKFSCYEKSHKFSVFAINANAC